MVFCRWHCAMYELWQWHKIFGTFSQMVLRRGPSNEWNMYIMSGTRIAACIHTEGGCSISAGDKSLLNVLWGTHSIGCAVDIRSGVFGRTAEYVSDGTWLSIMVLECSFWLCDIRISYSCRGISVCVYFIFTTDIIWRYGGYNSCELAKDMMCYEHNND